NTVQQPIALGFFQRLPLTFAWLGDELVVAGASEEYTTARGTRVLKIGGKTADEVMAALTPYVAHENDVWLRQEAPSLLRPRAVLEHLGLAGPNGPVELTLEKPGAAPFTLTVPPGDPRAAILPIDVTPLLARSEKGKWYWHRYLDNSATLFIQYNV